MGASKLSLFVLIILFLLPLSLASVSYSLVIELSNSATVTHDDSHSVGIKFTNENLACPVSCNAKMESDYADTSAMVFTVTTSSPVTKQFTLRSPSKKEANYEQDGNVKYTLNVGCTTIESIFPLCFVGNEVVSAKTADSKSFTLHFGLSSSEQQAKSEYEALVSSLQQDIENLYNQGNELESFYGNLIGNVLIPSETQQEITRLGDLGEDAFEKFEESQNEYGVLNVHQALSTLSPYKNTNFGSLLSDIANNKNELSELQKRHDEVVQRLKGVQKQLSESSEELQRAGLSTQYFSLVDFYEELQKKLNNLQFSSYESIESEITQIEEKIDELIELKKQEEIKIVDALNEAYFTETTKIGSQTQFLSKPTLTLTINQFCSDFKTSIPQQFRTFNDNEQKKIDLQNKKNKEYNAVLESMRSSWLELTNLVSNVINATEGKTFDKSLISGCDVTSILDGEFQQEDINTLITECESYRTILIKSIEDNQKPSSKFLNFFKYLFVNKPKLNQTKIPELDTFIRPTNLIYTPVEFSESTMTVIGEYCSFNPQSVSLQSPREVQSIGYADSDEVIEFSNIQGSCETLDCYNNRDTFPVLFVHGHMFTDSTDPMEESRYTFDNMIEYISNRHSNTFDAGTIVDKGNEFLDSGLKINAKVALLRTTYYGYAYIDSSGSFQFEKRNYEGIEEYANKLNGIIDSTLEKIKERAVEFKAIFEASESK